MAQPDQIDLFGSLNRDGRPLTVAEKGRRWMCSAETVRKLIRRAVWTASCWAVNWCVFRRTRDDRPSNPETVGWAPCESNE